MAGGILPIAIKDKNALYAQYMPFVQNGGLFIPTNKKYALGDEVLVVLSLPESADKVPVASTVVWITPQHAQGKTPGIGVKFNEQDEGATKIKIETLVAALLNTDKPTQTL